MNQSVPHFPAINRHSLPNFLHERRLEFAYSFADYSILRPKDLFKGFIFRKSALVVALTWLQGNQLRPEYVEDIQLPTEATRPHAICVDRYRTQDSE